MKTGLMVGLLVMSIVVSNADIRAETLTFAAAEWMPYTFVENDQVVGSQVEMVRAICQRLGVEADIQIFPWARVILMAQQGDVDAIFAPVKTEERMGFLDFTTEVLDIERNVLVARVGSGLKVAGLDDLRDKSIGVVRNVTYGAEFEQRTDLHKQLCTDDAKMMMMLDMERFDLAAGDEGNLKFLSKGLQHPVEVVYVLSETPDYIGFSKAKSEARSAALAAQFSRIMRALEQEGVLAQIRNKYMPVVVK